MGANPVGIAGTAVASDSGGASASGADGNGRRNLMAPERGDGNQLEETICPTMADRIEPAADHRFLAAVMLGAGQADPPGLAQEQQERASTSVGPMEATDICVARHAGGSSKDSESMAATTTTPEQGTNKASITPTEPTPSVLPAQELPMILGALALAAQTDQANAGSPTGLMRFAAGGAAATVAGTSAHINITRRNRG